MFITSFKVILSLVLCLYLMLSDRLTLSGMFLAMLNVLILQFIGGSIWLNIFLIISLLSMFIPKLFNKDNNVEKDVRNWKDMMAITINSFVCLIFNKIESNEILAIASFYSALAFILADIFSSEIRLSIWKSKARLISRGFKTVEHGVSGAISLSGILFSLIGASILGIHFYSISINLYLSLMILLVGFFVCFLESVFNDYKNVFKLNINNEITNSIFVLLSIILPRLIIIIM